MPRLEDYETWIEVDDVRLKEYAVESRIEERDIRCWIPSQEGKNFVIHYKDHSESRTIQWKLCADGHECGSIFTLPDKPQVAEAGMPISATEEQLYHFARVTLTEDEHAALQDESLVKQLGTLKIVAREGTTVPTTFHNSSNMLLEDKPVHEQAKKAAGHRVVGGTTVENICNWVDFEPSGEDPITIVFQYGPEEFLQAKDIMPRPARTPHVGHEREEENDDPHDENNEAEEENNEADSEDERAAKARILQLEEELAALRKRDKRKGKRPPMKREDGHSASKRPKMEDIEPNHVFKRGEVIDLT
ncbi:hypothetical protein CALCODRAFT_495875 [Calocera cornea HHB12733]|uniref:DUF7918 domain-containing protein n=1 Tax=Calocera cornea HHB12733 TaxID=1353952 RepID=A0A165G5W1_9BASI|nr:hypothetical protein CALCODRAFT_495875 [Calocera cornea HHB12733]